MMRKAVAASLLSLLVLPVGVHAQRASETVQVTLVEVPVNVTRNGEPVRDLKAENFEIYDQGLKRQITNFEMIDFSKRAGAAAAEPIRSPAARRRFMILFDLGTSSPSSLLRAREATLNFVDKHLLPSDRVAVGTSSAQQGLQLLTGFTTDRALVRSAIETLGAPRLYQTTDPLRLSAELSAAAEDAMQSQAKYAASVAEHLHDMASLQKKAGNQAQKQYVMREVDQLAELGRVLDRVKGRKQVILLSEGFDSRMLHGRDSLSSVEQREEQLNVERGEVWKVDTDNRYGGSEATTALRRMIDALRRSDVVLHAVDIRGLRSSSDPSSPELNITDVGAASSQGFSAGSIDSLHLLTRDTGGTVFKNTNDLGSDFERMLKAQEVTYILGFNGPSNTPGKFHELKVKLVNVPDARVTHRVGYYEPSAATSDLDRTLSAGEIIVDSIPVDTIRLRGFAAPVPSKSGVAHVPVVLEIDGKSLAHGLTGKVIPAEAFIYAFDDKEMIRDFAYQPMSLDLGKVRDKLMGKGVKFYQTLRLPPGDYSLRILVRSGGGQRNGFQRIALNVPAPGEAYIMPPLLFDDTSEWVMVKAPDRDPDFTYPFQVGTDTFVPALRRVLSQGATYTLALFAYNVPGNLNVQASIDDGTSPKSVSISFLGRAPDPEGAIKLVYELKLPQLAPGDYSLVLNVRVPAGVENRLAIPFAVN